MKKPHIYKWIVIAVSILSYFVMLLPLQGQIPGQVIKPALTGKQVLDPDLDGYVSLKTNGVQQGFTTPPHDDVLQSEIPYAYLQQYDPMGDLLKGPDCSFTDLLGVESSGNNAIGVYRDAGNNLLFRFRVGNYSPNSKAYGVFIDTDQRFGLTGPDADPNAVAGNPGFEVEIVLRTNFSIDVNKVDGTINPVLQSSFSYDNNCQKSVTVTNACNNPDFFYDFFVPFSSLQNIAGLNITLNTPMRFVAVSGMSPQSIIASGPSDIAGTGETANPDNIYTDLINIQTPVTPNDINNGIPPRSECPVLNIVTSGSIVVSGTTVEPVGTTLQVKVYSSAGALLESKSISTTGVSWSVTLTGNVAAGNKVTAIATAPGKGPSAESCNMQTIAATPLPPLVIDQCLETGTCGENLIPGATLNVYYNGILIESTSSNTSVVHIGGITFMYKPNGNFNNCSAGQKLMLEGVYQFSQTVDGVESVKVSCIPLSWNSCLGQTKISAPVITSPLYNGIGLTISGTSDAYLRIEVLKNNISLGTVFANGSGHWTISGITLAAGDIVTAVARLAATSPLTCYPGFSAPVIVAPAPAPVITSDACGTVTAVSGYVNATAGSVRIFNSSNVALGTAVTVGTDGNWSITGLNITSGGYYARALYTGGAFGNSLSRTVRQKTSNIPVISTVTITELTTTSLTGTGVTNDTIKLYVDNVQVILPAVVRVSAGTWTITNIPSYAFYAGATVYVTATSPVKCEGDPSAVKTVLCNPPAVPLYTGGSYSYCTGNAGTILIQNSQLFVVYQLTDAAGNSAGPPKMGTGGNLELNTFPLTGNLTNIFVSAYRLFKPECKTISTVPINYDVQNPAPSITLTGTYLSVQRGTTAASLLYSVKSTNPSADKYTIDFSPAANLQGFADITLAQNIPANAIPIAVPASAAVNNYMATLTIHSNTPGSCSSNYSFTISVYSNSQPPIISMQPMGTEVCFNTGTVMSVLTPNLGVTYQWQSARAISGPYAPVVGGSGATTASYTTPFLTSDIYYRVIVSNAYGSTLSTIATVTISAIAPGTWDGDTDNNWNNAFNWSCNFLPDLTTNVLIGNGKPHYPVLSLGPAGMARNLTIQNSASLTVSGNTLQIAGSISNAGSFTADEGTIELRGSVVQTIPANTFTGNNILNLTLTNSAGATVAGSLNILGVLKAQTGNIASNGNIKLISTPLRTALIDGAGNGQVTGDVTIQRYIASSFGYKYFASPFTALTVGDFTPYLELTESFATFYRYDENNKNTLGQPITGWIKYVQPSGLLNPFHGYTANLGTNTSSVTMEFSGIVNNGTFTRSLSNNNGKFTKGYNFIGNPYPSPINWDAPGWTKTKVDNAIYFFNAGTTDRYLGTYSSYVNGVATGNGSNVIPAYQAFFVHVKDTANPTNYPVNGSLTITNAVRVNNLNPVFHKNSNEALQIKIAAAFTSPDGPKDFAVSYFDSDATGDFDTHKDALKLMNTEPLVPNIYFITEGGRELSINGIPEPSAEITEIALGINTLQDGTIMISTGDMSMLPSNRYLYLLDTESNIRKDLLLHTHYKFSLRKGKYDNRFKLIISNFEMGEITEEDHKLFIVTGGGASYTIYTTLPDEEKGTIIVYNIAGQKVHEKDVTGKETIVVHPSTGAGAYVVTISAMGRRETAKIIVTQKHFE